VRPKTLLSLENDPEQGDTAGVHRWMVSYADFVSLLFVLFLVLYAKLPKQPTQPAVPSPPPVQSVVSAAPHPETAPPRAPTLPVYDSLPGPPFDANPIDAQAKLLSALAENLRDLVTSGDITLVQRDEGVALEIKDTALFASGSAEPAERSHDIFAKVSSVLAQEKNSIVVEGHTDSVPIQNSRYPSNWELSTARAAAVVRALQEHGIPPGRLTAAGLAATKPRSSNDTAQGRSANRRVSLVLLNSAAEARAADSASEARAADWVSPDR
jgi:chemotaxis protein MotB